MMHDPYRIVGSVVGILPTEKLIIIKLPDDLSTPDTRLLLVKLNDDVILEGLSRDDHNDEVDRIACPGCGQEVRVEAEDRESFVQFQTEAHDCGGWKNTRRKFRVMKGHKP